MANMQLLQASVGEDTESDFRLLFDGLVIKYITIDPDLFSVDDMCFGPSLVTLLPSFPHDDWNVAHIAKDPSSGKPHVASLLKEQLPEITHTWHPRRVEYLDLHIGEKLRSNVYEATSPLFASTIVIKFACFWWEIPHLDDETTAYEWIDGQGIGPAFLGHLTEGGRVIGFLMERVEGFRHATPSDLQLCRQALGRLHKLGIRHGDTNKHNLLVHGGKVTMIDFDIASRDNEAQELADELDGLLGQLEDMSGRGGRIIGSIVQD